MLLGARNGGNLPKDSSGIDRKLAVQIVRLVWTAGQKLPGVDQELEQMVGPDAMEAIRLAYEKVKDE